MHPWTGERKTLGGPLSEVQLDDPQAADGALPGAQIPNWRVFTFSLSLDFLETCISPRLKTGVGIKLPFSFVSQKLQM